MDNYNKWVITKAYAENETSAVNSSNKIEFIRFVTSDDEFDYDSLKSFTNSVLNTINVRQNFPVSYVSPPTSSTVSISGVATSQGNANDYYVNTVLLICRYNNAEFLAAATTAINAFRVPAESPTEHTEFTIRPQLTLSHLDTISTLVNPVAPATNERVDDEVAGLQSQLNTANSDRVNIWQKIATLVDLACNQTITGVKTFTQNIVGSITGNAGTATKLKDSRSIGITGDISGSASFDGSANASIASTLATVNQSDTTSTQTATNSGTVVMVDDVTRDSKGRVTGANKKTVTLPAGYTHPNTTRTNTTSNEAPANASTFEVIDSVTTNAAGHITGVNTKTVTMPTQTNIAGNAATATKLAIGRKVKITGDISYTSPDFDGSADVSATATLAEVSRTNNTSTASTSNGGTFTAIDSLTTDSKGRVTAINTKTITLPPAQTAITGNAGTATKLATGRTIATTGDVVWTSPTFDGSGNVTAVATLASVSRTDNISSNSVAYGGTFTAIDSLTTDSKGRVTAINTKTVTIPVAQTTVTGNAGSADSLNATNSAVVDLNNITGSGERTFFINANQTVANAPYTSIAYFIKSTITESLRLQEAFPTDSTKASMYRTFSGSAWTAWRGHF